MAIRHVNPRHGGVPGVREQAAERPELVVGTGKEADVGEAVVEYVGETGRDVGERLRTNVGVNACGPTRLGVIDLHHIIML